MFLQKKCYSQIALEGSYKIFNTELKQAGYVVHHNLSVGGKNHLYMDAVSVVTAIPKENRGYNGYKSWGVFHGIINNKKHLGY